MLSENELARYKRQIMIPDWGREGQERLKRSKVLVAGAGGLGSPILTCLAVAGVGTIRVVDGDSVELSNLNRQTLHRESDIGKMKVDSARERLEELNPNVRVEAVGEQITESNVFDLVEDYPIVDAMDNLPARYLLNRSSLRRKLPLFHGAVYGFEGRATTIIPGETACLRCLYQGVLPGETPVAGITTAVIGAVQATEVIKYLLGIGELLRDRLLVYDGLNLSFEEVRLKRDPNCDECAPKRP